MSVRFYLLPLAIHSSGARHPKYIPLSILGYAGEPSLRPFVRLSLQDYGLEPVCFMGYDSTSETQHATLAAFPDVTQFPVDLDQALGADRQVVTDRMEAFNIPGDWATGSTTYRELARSMLGMFHLGQVFKRLGQSRFFPEGVTLNTHYGNLDPGYRSALDVSMAERAIDTSALVGTTTMRALFRMIGEQQIPEPLLGVLI